MYRHYKSLLSSNHTRIYLFPSSYALPTYVGIHSYLSVFVGKNLIEFFIHGLEVSMAQAMLVRINNDTKSIYKKAALAVINVLRHFIICIVVRCFVSFVYQYFISFRTQEECNFICVKDIWRNPYKYRNVVRCYKKVKLISAKIINCISNMVEVCDARRYLSIS